MNKLLLTRAIFVLSLIGISVSTLFAVRDFQDSWILEGVEIPFIIFVASLLTFFYFEKDVKWILAATVVARIAFLFIPSFKYDYFAGRSIDQHLQLNLVNELVQNGNLSLSNISAEIITVIYYASTPMLSIILGVYTIFLDIDAQISLKIVPLILNITYPIFTYMILSQIQVFKDKDILKTSLFFLAIPNTSAFYIVTGSVFIYVFTFLLLYAVIKIIIEQSIVNNVIFLMFFFTSLLSHSIYTVHNFFIFVGIIAILLLFKKIQIDKNTFRIIIVSTGISTIILLSQKSFIEYIKQIFNVKGVGITVPSTFITLLKTNVTQALGTITYYYGSDFFFIILLLFSLFYIFKNLNLNSKSGLVTTTVVLFLIITGILSTAGFILGIGFGYWQRIFRLSSLTFPMIASYFILFIKKPKLKNGVIAVTMIIFAILSSIQLYEPPNILPNAKTLNPTLSEDTPLVYNGEANSIYQRTAINFAFNNVKGRIATDAVTRNQFLGLTTRSYFNLYITWYYPPSTNIYNNIEIKPYQYVVTHLPGISGAFEEVASIRDNKTIINFMVNETSNIIYTNSESLIDFNLNYSR